MWLLETLNRSFPLNVPLVYTHFVFAIATGLLIGFSAVMLVRCATVRQKFSGVSCSYYVSDRACLETGSTG